MGKNRPTKKHTAYHEGGHVVAHFALGLAVNKASIIPKEGSLGQALSPPVLGYESGGSRREQRQIARANIIGCYAGMEAEWIFDPNARDSGGGDNQTAFWLSRTYCVLPRYCQYVGDEQHLDYLDRLRREARRLVRRHWQAVEEVAASLLKNKRLDGKKLEAIRSRLFPD